MNWLDFGFACLAFLALMLVGNLHDHRADGTVDYTVGCLGLFWLAIALLLIAINLPAGWPCGAGR